MAFHSQQPAASEEVGDLHLNAGPDMIWTSRQNLDSTLQLDHNFNLPQQTKEFDFQPESSFNGAASNVFIHGQQIPTGISQTGPPFRTAQSHVSYFRQFNTDCPVTSKKHNETETYGPTLDELPTWTKSDVHFGDHNAVSQAV